MATKNKRLVLWLLGFVVLISVLTTAGVVLLLDSTPVTLNTEAQLLHLRLRSNMTEAPGNEGMVMDPAELPPLTSEVAAAVRTAASDDTVSGLLVEIDGLNIGWGQAEELRSALAHFSETEKPCTTWAEGYDIKGYFVASACGTIAMTPEGLTLVNGMNINHSYYAGTLELLGVQANFEHVGDFKSAVEPYERTEPSEAAQLATNSLLDSLYGSVTQAIATGRGVDVSTITALIDNPPITGADAQERGLIDERVYRSDLLQRIDDDQGRIKGNVYIGDQRGGWSVGETIAVVHADGPIVSGRGGSDMFGESMIGSRGLNKILDELAEDDNTVAVVLRVNSPGGSGMASDDIWNRMLALKAKKPVVVSMADYAASGGYYISMPADRILALPTTITGSIGVFGGKMNLAGLFDKAGMTRFEYSRGARSDLLSTVENFDEDDRALFRHFLNTFYETFLTKAAEGRGITKEAVHAVAQGRVWTGVQALEHGLIDELGGLHDAVRIAAELADVSSYSVTRLPERKGFLDQLLDEMTNPDNVRIQIPGVPLEMTRPIQSLLVLEQVLNDGGVAAMLPGQIEID
jgi:protease IV